MRKPHQEKSETEGLTEKEDKGEEETVKDRLSVQSVCLSSPLTEKTKSWLGTTQMSFWKYFSLLMLVSRFQLPFSLRWSFSCGL